MASIWKQFVHLLHDPLPDYAFELSEAGIAFARPAVSSEVFFQPLDPGVISVSPLADNVLKPDALADAVRSIVGRSAGRKRRQAVLILPDYCARVAVLEFDHFPTDSKEQTSLVRFRMKKSVPFDVETAAISFHPQAAKAGKTDALVVAAALEIIARYEAPFRGAGLHPGHVTTSAVAMAELNQAPGVSVLARLSGRVLSILVMNGPALKLVRTVELSEVSDDEVLAVLLPTLAYIEDEMAALPSRMLLCGFDHQHASTDWTREVKCPVERLQSRFGVPNPSNAGLLAYLESVTAGAKAA
jgi:type IV pilus assembly protein PilM